MAKEVLLVTGAGQIGLAIVRRMGYGKKIIIPAYLFMKLPFAFFDYSEPRVFFLADYLAVMILFAMLGYEIIEI